MSHKIEQLLLTECDCTADEHSSARMKLSPHDAARMACLYEELNSRLTEISGIIARNLGHSATSFTVARIKGALSEADAPTEGHIAAKRRSKHPLLVCSSAGCGYYDYESGECYTC